MAVVGGGLFGISLERPRSVFVLRIRFFRLLKALWEGHTAALQIMLAETACDLQTLACNLNKDGCHASGERSDGQQSLPRKVAKSRPKYENLL